MSNPELKEIKGNDGKTLSPVLPEEVKNYLIDIDGTITDDVPNEVPERMENHENSENIMKMLNSTKTYQHYLIWSIKTIQQFLIFTKQY